MFYLIGGAPRVGKTIIAKKLASIVRGQLIFTDELEKKLKLSLEVYFSNNSDKDILTPDEQVETLIREADLLRDEIFKVFEDNKNKSQDVIIEGVPLLPKDVVDLINKFGGENIKSVFIGSIDLELILKGIDKNTGFNNWPRDYNEAVKRRIALLTKTFSHYLIKETGKFGLLYKERSNNFKKDTDDIIKNLTH